MEEGKITLKMKPAPRDRVFHVRVSASEYEAVDALAERLELTTSSLVRMLILEGAEVSPILSDEERVLMLALRDEIRAIGVNLNQVARALNAQRQVDAAEINLNIANVDRMLRGLMIELRMLAKRGGQRRRGEASS